MCKDRTYCDSYMDGDGECGLQEKYRNECEHWHDLMKEKASVSGPFSDRVIGPAEEVCKDVMEWLDQNGHGEVERKKYPDLHNKCFACKIYDKAKAAYTGEAL